MILLFVAAVLSSIPSTQAVERNTLAGDFERYAKLYPTHAEYCAGTELTFINGVAGGPGGHGFTYVHGLCKDRAADHPKVKVCDDADRAAGHFGVGISVNSDFDNVNWVAVPGHSLFLDGALTEGEAITRNSLDRVASIAYDERVFENIILNKPELTRDSAGRQLTPGTKEYLHAVAINSIGTDIATRFGRNLECVRLPILPSTLPKIAAHLNDLNAQYYGVKGAHYKWDGKYNNCAHVASEILALANVRDAIPKNLSFFEQLGHLALPRNGVYTLINNGITDKMSPFGLFNSKEERTSIKSGDPFLVRQVGVLAKRYREFQDNQVFEVSSKAIWIPALHGSVLLDKNKFDMPEYSDIDANLRLWEKDLVQELADLESDSFREKARNFFSFLTFHKGQGHRGYADFHDAYRGYLEKKLEFVRQNLR